MWVFVYFASIALFYAVARFALDRNKAAAVTFCAVCASGLLGLGGMFIS